MIIKTIEFKLIITSPDSITPETLKYILSAGRVAGFIYSVASYLIYSRPLLYYTYFPSLRSFPETMSFTEELEPGAELLF
jgi:hypothetical protein